VVYGEFWFWLFSNSETVSHNSNDKSKQCLNEVTNELFTFFVAENTEQDRLRVMIIGKTQVTSISEIFSELLL